MNDLTALAERCEKAEGPDRELDLCIHEDLGNCVHRETEYYAVQSDTGFTCKACRKDTYGFRVPNYTTSLDAAMSLVPEGFQWWFSCGSVRPTGEPPEVNESFAQVWSHGLGVNCRAGDDNHGKIATPALALCAAALRARVALNEAQPA